MSVTASSICSIPLGSLYNAAVNVTLDFQPKSSSCYKDSNPLQIPVSSMQRAISVLVTGNVEGCKAAQTDREKKKKKKHSLCPLYGSTPMHFAIVLI